MTRANDPTLECYLYCARCKSHSGVVFYSTKGSDLGVLHAIEKDGGWGYMWLTLNDSAC